MDKGIYTALSGGLAKGHELELIAHNLANANTPGFKRDTGTFNEYLTELRRHDTVSALEREVKALTMMEGRPPGDKSFVEMDGIYTDFAPGTLYRTGRTLDLGLEGEGFIEVLTPQGIRYTRQGNLSLSKDGNLVTASGHPILKHQEGVAPEARTIQLGQGHIQISQDGTLFQNGAAVGKISIQEFYETQWLEKVGTAYYKNDRVENLRPVKLTQVHAGFLEGSNVNPVTEMTRLIEATRAYEAHMQAVKTYHEMDNKSANEIVRQR